MNTQTLFIFLTIGVFVFASFSISLAGSLVLAPWGDRQRDYIRAAVLGLMVLAFVCYFAAGQVGIVHHYAPPLVQGLQG